MHGLVSLLFAKIVIVFELQIFVLTLIYDDTYMYVQVSLCVDFYTVLRHY